MIFILDLRQLKIFYYLSFIINILVLCFPDILVFEKGGDLEYGQWLLNIGASKYMPFPFIISIFIILVQPFAIDSMSLILGFVIFIIVSKCTYKIYKNIPVSKRSLKCSYRESHLEDYSSPSFQIGIILIGTAIIGIMRLILLFTYILDSDLIIISISSILLFISGFSMLIIGIIARRTNE